VCLGFHGLYVHKTQCVAQFPPQKDITPQGLEFRQRPFLVNRLNTQFSGFWDSKVFNLLAVEVDLTTGGLVIAGENLDKG
jgi:hypothetical protein